MEQSTIIVKKGYYLGFIILIILILVATLPFHWIFYKGEIKVFPKDILSFNHTIVTESDIQILIERHNSSSFFEQINIRNESLHKKLVEAGIIIIENKNDDNNPKYSDLKGKVYRSLKEFEEMKDFEEAGGTVIESLDNIEYALSHYKNGSTHIIGFEEVIGYFDGKAKYKLIDILEIKNLDADQWIDCGSCRLNKKYDTELFTIYVPDHNDKEFHTKIVKVWRANRKSGKIEPVETNGIDCENESYGN